MINLPFELVNFVDNLWITCLDMQKFLEKFLEFLENRSPKKPKKSKKIQKLFFCKSLKNKVVITFSPKIQKYLRKVIKNVCYIYSIYICIYYSAYM